MSECDLTLATGGPGMVKSAYSSGKPAIGVGAGTQPVAGKPAPVIAALALVVHGAKHLPR